MRSSETEAEYRAMWGYSQDPRAQVAGREVAGTCAVHRRPDAGSRHAVLPEYSGPPHGAEAELCPGAPVVGVRSGILCTPSCG